MDISLELTWNPIQDDCELIIKDFIKSLRSSNLKILETPLNTQVYGDYKKVMNFINDELYKTFLNSKSIIMNMKIIKSDRSDYAPIF